MQIKTSTIAHFVGYLLKIEEAIAPTNPIPNTAAASDASPS